jgi:hypothetical protein
VAAEADIIHDPAQVGCPSEHPIDPTYEAVEAGSQEDMNLVEEGMCRLDLVAVVGLEVRVARMWAVWMRIR